MPGVLLNVQVPPLQETIVSVPLLRTAVTLPVPLIVIVRVGEASVKDVCACNPERLPVAVRVNVMEMSCESGEN